MKIKWFEVFQVAVLVCLFPAIIQGVTGIQFGGVEGVLGLVSFLFIYIYGAYFWFGILVIICVCVYGVYHLIKNKCKWIRIMLLSMCALLNIVESVFAYFYSEVWRWF